MTPMPDEEMAMRPQPRQAYAMQCPADEIFFGGAVGGGKSFCALLINVRGVAQYAKDWRAIIFRKTYPQLQEIAREARRMYIPLGAVYNSTKHIFSFPNGAETVLASLDTDNNVEKYQGHQFTFIVFDELGNWASDYCWVYMVSRNRSAAGVPCQMLGTGNPGGVGHAWIKNRWIDGFKPNIMYKIPVFKDKQGNWRYRSQCFIPSLLEDNMALMKNDPEYETRLMNMPDYLLRALRFGDWDVFAGQVFDEWRREQHTVKPFALPAARWFKFYSLDWGYNKPYAIVKLAVNYDGKVIQYGELYGCIKGEPNKGTREASKEVAARAWEDAVMEGVVDMIADPAIWSKQDNAPSPADNFAEAGFKMQKANNQRVVGLENFHNFLKSKDENEAPMFQAFSTCYQTIRTLPVLTPDPHNPEDVDTALEDHLYDALRYGLMSRFAARAQRTLERQHSAYKGVSKQRYNVMKEW
jgi:hypothetical protein